MRFIHSIVLNTVPEFVYNTRSVSIVNQIENQFSQFIYNKRRRMETQNLKLLISVHYLRFACYTRRLKTFTHNHTHNHTHNFKHFKQRAKGGVSSLNSFMLLTIRKADAASTFPFFFLPSNQMLVDRLAGGKLIFGTFFVIFRVCRSIVSMT